MTFVLLAVAIVAAAVTVAAVAGTLPVSFADPVAKQAVARARRRSRITRQTLAVFSQVYPVTEPSGPLFPPPVDEDDDEFPRWRPTPD
jgi:hypothetical protein